MENFLRIEKIIINIFSPFTIIVFLLAIACFVAFPQPSEKIRWFLFTLIIMFVPSFLYMYRMRAKSKEQASDFRSFFRKSKKRMFISTLLFLIPPSLAFYFIDYPSIISAPLASFLTWRAVNTILNLKIEVSYHLGDIALLLFSLWFLIGEYSLFGIPLIPLIAVSKKRIGHHTVSQMIVGFLTAAVITTVIFSQLGFQF